MKIESLFSARIGETSYEKLKRTLVIITFKKLAQKLLKSVVNFILRQHIRNLQIDPISYFNFLVNFFLNYQKLEQTCDPIHNTLFSS